MSVPDFLPYYVLIGTAGIVLVISMDCISHAFGLFLSPPSYLQAGWQPPLPLAPRGLFTPRQMTSQRSNMAFSFRS